MPDPGADLPRRYEAGAGMQLDGRIPRAQRPADLPNPDR